MTERSDVAAQRDAVLLGQAGYRIEWLRRQPGLHAASVSRGGEATKLEWVVDSDYRYFPPSRIRSSDTSFTRSTSPCRR